VKVVLFFLRDLEVMVSKFKSNFYESLGKI